MSEVAEIEQSAANAPAAESEAIAQPAQRVHLADRRLPVLIELEPFAQRAMGIVAIIVICALYAFTLKTFWAPADGGVDQNAYLVGGKQIALHGSTRFEPAHPFEYVGAMMIVPTKKTSSGNVPAFNGGYYPKYPFGQSLLFAVPQIVLGRDLGVRYAFAMNPIGAVLAVAGMFFLARAIAGTFAATLAAILLATCPVMLVLANGANSHPSCVACVVWGMFFLLRWWQTGSIWRGILAGFLLAYACLIRYSEGLLVLPIIAVAAMKMRWRDWRSYLRNATPLLAWFVPVAALLIYNKLTIGQLTGYDSSNESGLGSGFTLERITQNWDLVLRTFHDMALFFTLPLGLAGLIMLFARSWRAALVMVLWLVPVVTLYMAYYWSPDRGVSYARFFLTSFPALLVGFAVCIRYGILRIGALDHSFASYVALPIAAGLITAIAASVGTLRSIQNDENGGVGGFAEILPAQLQGRLSLASAGQMLRQHAKQNDVVFTEDVRGPNGASNYLAFAIDARLFTFSAFERGGGGRGMRFGGNQDADAPNPQQKQKMEVIRDQYGDKTDRDLIAEQNQITDETIAAGHKVFLFGSQGSIDAFKRKFLAKGYDVVIVDRWKDPPPAPQPAQPPRRPMGGPRNAVRNLVPGPRGETRINDWKLAEVRKQTSRAPSPSPATRPASSPAMARS